MLRRLLRKPAFVDLLPSVFRTAYEIAECAQPEVYQMDSCGVLTLIPILVALLLSFYCGDNKSLLLFSPLLALVSVHHTGVTED